MTPMQYDRGRGLYLPPRHGQISPARGPVIPRRHRLPGHPAHAPWRAAITLDGTPANSSTAATTLTFSATVGAGSNRLLALSVAARDIGGGAPTSVKWLDGGAGTNLTVSANRNSGTGLYASVWYLVAPSVGTFNVEVASSSCAWLAACAFSLQGVHQVTPLDHTAGANDSTEVAGANVISLSSFSTTNDGCAIVDCCSSNQPLTAMTAITNRTEWMRTDPGGAGDGAGASALITKSPAGSVNMEWDIEDGVNGCLAAMGFQPAAGAATPPSKRLRINYIPIQA